jgi:hypothetical protein
LLLFVVERLGNLHHRRHGIADPLEIGMRRPGVGLQILQQQRIPRHALHRRNQETGNVGEVGLGIRSALANQLRKQHEMNQVISASRLRIAPLKG